MGKGGDAAAAKRGPMKLVGEKSEKITWGEVKKHVSLVGQIHVADCRWNLFLIIEFLSTPPN